MIYIQKYCLHNLYNKSALESLLILHGCYNSQQEREGQSSFPTVHRFQLCHDVAGCTTACQARLQGWRRRGKRVFAASRWGSKLRFMGWDFQSFGGVGLPLASKTCSWELYSRVLEVYSFTVFHQPTVCSHPHTCTAGSAKEHSAATRHSKRGKNRQSHPNSIQLGKAMQNHSVEAH